MSDFSVPVVKVGEITKHPNADKLSITTVDGCPVIFQTADLKSGDLAVYVPVEAVVPLSNPAFEFLKDPNHPERETSRIKAKRLRGVFSMGLLIPRTAFPATTFAGRAEEGQDIAALLGIVKWEEPELQPSAPAKPKVKVPWWRMVWFWIRHPLRMWRFRNRDNGQEKGPGGNVPVYDMESLRKFRSVIEPNEPVYVSEKIHGCNARYIYQGGRLWVGSHRTWKKQDANSWWWKMAIHHDLETKLKKHPNMVVYGEIYGAVQDLKYGAKGDEIFLAVFDVWDATAKKFLDYQDFVTFIDCLGLPRVPMLYTGPYSPEAVDVLANGKTTMPDAVHIREGIVIKPLVERQTHMGRVILKLVSEDYLTRKNGTEAH